MRRIPLRRLGKGLRRWLRLAVAISLAILFIDTVFTITLDFPAVRVQPSKLTQKERIFIASMHWNNEAIIRSHWTPAMLDLARHFGPENVYVSVSESGSWDNTKGALRELDEELEKLGVERSIKMFDSTHKDEIDRIPEFSEEGWIRTSRGKKELRRIPYLAGIRNQVMDKLKELAERAEGRGKRSFDKILWLNDVVFTTEDVTTLIATRDGEYAAACALDFSHPPFYYDTFALRDISGAKAVTQTWPYFLAAESRNAIISNSPVPVKSCWNGIVVFQASPFYKDPPLRFRGVPDSLATHHLEGSECCLIHADNELSVSQGVWLNPNVRVSYNPEADKIVNPESHNWPSTAEKVMGIWFNRWARFTGVLERYMERYRVNWRLQSWKDEMQNKGVEKYGEEAAYCLINEMQVLVQNGWAHV